MGGNQWLTALKWRKVPQLWRPPKGPYPPPDIFNSPWFWLNKHPIFSEMSGTVVRKNRCHEKEMVRGYSESKDRKDIRSSYKPVLTARWKKNRRRRGRACLSPIQPGARECHPRHEGGDYPSCNWQRFARTRGLARHASSQPQSPRIKELASLGRFFATSFSSHNYSTPRADITLQIVVY